MVLVPNVSYDIVTKSLLEQGAMIDVLVFSYYET